MLRPSSNLSHSGTRALSLAFVLALAAGVGPACAQSSQDPVYIFHTTLGNIRVQLYPDVTPKTVANFLSYVNSGAYNSSFIHRSAKDSQNHPFVIQGGGYTVNSNAQVSEISANGPVAGEAQLSNTRGTIAMALSTGPNSGMDEWFFNEEDNSALLDGTSDGGPFTVFGKIADSASLAVMDQIAAVQTYNKGGAFSQIPLINYNGGTVAEGNFVRITSITPAGTAVSISQGADGNTRILWDNVAGQATVWTLNSAGTLLDHPTFGPFTGWTAKAIATGSDGNTRILWTNVNGQATVWTINNAGTMLSDPQFGPITGWTATALSVGPDNLPRLLWDNTNGEAALWTLNASGGVASGPTFGPFTGWFAKAIATGSDGNTRILWDNTSGQATVWTLNGSGNLLSDPQFGPIAGWTATALSVGPDDLPRLLWNNSNGEAAVWVLNASGGVADGPTFGPISGWGAVGLSTGSDGNTRLLWDNVSGQSSFWDVAAAGSYTASPTYGP